MAKRTVQSTKNYRLFGRHEGENRELDLPKHRKLLQSLKLYGFIPSYPIICYRDKNGNLVIKDGQHRFTIAESLGLPIHWIEETIDFDVAIVNSTAKVWVIKDYAEKHVANGKKEYQEGMDFSEQHGMPLGLSFALLAGTTTFGNCQDSFINGAWKVKDRSWANLVASIYGPLALMNPKIKVNNFIGACMAVCRVPEFDPKRLIANAAGCREKLVSYSTQESFLDMLEDIYNFRRQKLVGLKALANMAMRERSPVKGKKKAEPAASAAQKTK